jgi:filamentous hemagglutinin
MMNAAQAAGQTVAQGIGDYADKKREDALNAAETALNKGDLSGAAAALAEADQWKEGGSSRVELQAMGGALIGGLGGGSPFSALGGAAGAGLSSRLADQTKQLSSAVSDATGSSLIGNIGGNIAVGLGGALIGGSAGAAMASNVNLYNQGRDTDDKKSNDKAASLQEQLESARAATLDALTKMQAGIANGAIDLASAVVNIPNGGPMATPGDPGYISLDGLKQPYAPGDQVGPNAELLSALLGTRGVGKGAGATEVVVNNPVSSTLARVVPGNINPSMLGAPSAMDVFVTNANELYGLNAAQIAQKLTIPESLYGFNVIEFPTSSVSGIASPINRTNPGFVNGGKTAGGAPEFTIPNGPLPNGSTTRFVP